MTREEKLDVLARAVEAGHFGEGRGWLRQVMSASTRDDEVRFLLTTAADLLDGPLERVEADHLIAWVIYDFYTSRRTPDIGTRIGSLGREILDRLFGAPTRSS